MFVSLCRHETFAVQIINIPDTSSSLTLVRDVLIKTGQSRKSVRSSLALLRWPHLGLHHVHKVIQVVLLLLYRALQRLKVAPDVVDLVLVVC
jgi:hypothetical protein